MGTCKYVLSWPEVIISPKLAAAVRIFNGFGSLEDCPKLPKPDLTVSELE